MAIILMGISILMPSCKCFFLRRFKVTHSIENCLRNGHNIIKLSEVTHFQWDSVYFFPNGYGHGDWGPIHKRLPCYTREMFVDIGDRWVFVKDEKVVYEEAWYTTQIYPEGFTFLIFSPGGFFAFSKEDAVFKISNYESINSYFKGILLTKVDLTP